MHASYDLHIIHESCVGWTAGFTAGIPRRLEEREYGGSGLSREASEVDSVVESVECNSIVVA